MGLGMAHSSRTGYGGIRHCHQTLFTFHLVLLVSPLGVDDGVDDRGDHLFGYFWLATTVGYDGKDAVVSRNCSSNHPATRCDGDSTTGRGSLADTDSLGNANLVFFVGYQGRNWVESVQYVLVVQFVGLDVILVPHPACKAARVLVPRSFGTLWICLVGDNLHNQPVSSPHSRGTIFDSDGNDFDYVSR